jgi:hypothetical protein
MPVFVHILFADWTGRAVFFVTRQKSNAAYDVVETRAPPQNRNILSDDINARMGLSWTTVKLLMKYIGHRNDG